MALTIYEVISGGTKTHHPPNGDDWSVLVAANNPLQAYAIAFLKTEVSKPWVIYEWGIDARKEAEPGVLRGPFQGSTPVCRGWKKYGIDVTSENEVPAIYEWT